MYSLEELPIDDCHITLLEIDPLKNLNLQLLTFPDGKEYYLCFFKLAGFQINLISTESNRASVSIFTDSIFLKKIHEEQKESSMFNLEIMSHYHFKYGDGFIDIAAEGVSCSLIWDAKGDHILDEDR